MDNQMISKVLDRVYNGWWLRWRRKVIPKDSPVWEDVTREAGAILNEFNHHPFVVHLIQDLLDELERRSRDGEKRAREETA